MLKSIVSNSAAVSREAQLNAAVPAVQDRNKPLAVTVQDRVTLQGEVAGSKPGKTASPRKPVAAQVREDAVKPLTRDSGVSAAGVPKTLTVLEDDFTLAAVNLDTDSLLNDKTCMKWDRIGKYIGDRPNYREVDGIRGVAQPSLKGLRDILDDLNAREREVVWTNLREEPVCYINGEPFSLRSKAKITQNLDFPGISEHKVDALEEKLKREIQHKLSLGETLGYYTEDEQGGLHLQVIDPVNCNSESVKTIKEAFNDFKKAGYQVDFKRVPISDDRRPENQDFDALVSRYKTFNPESTYVNNCQGGGGRTTTGMVVFSLMKNARSESQAADGDKDNAFSLDAAHLAGGDAGLYKSILSAATLAKTAVNLLLLKGDDWQDFNAITEQQGAKGRDLLKVIDELASKDPQKARNFLERYVYLAVFNQYCLEQSPQDYPQTFSQWVKPHETKINLILKGLNTLCGI